ncbi:hypothetical protein GA0061099_1004151 [Bradyrhizobium yuanmingense]|uniref:Uncharacterized protein n=1 Tax=Bradyrhizobium yuanmingense TaxID=108015 RepID=A0A1C3VLN4_9BRAD|nr:hypothetical protein [Bradyrhizobium yuanmingense]TWI28565.1 hypothetical protein IQ15_01910 [Bradyrhizobium yuanmingense]SCB28404.1 hypothetical protein GA0061099_1004151 [Bradyrhizobium yuanmingense]
MTLVPRGSWRSVAGRSAGAITVALILQLPQPALAGGITIDSREYKLLLTPTDFAGDPNARAAEFWDGRLKPIISTHLDRRESGESRAKKSFVLRHQRRVSFKDTAGCTLSLAGFSYRERAALTAERGAATVETTLKFRSPDIFISNASSFAGQREAKSKFEEDISIPIQGAKTRSSYSHSVSQKQAGLSPPATLKDVMDTYPGAWSWLESVSTKPPQLGANLIAGPVFAELVFSRAEVDLGHDADAEFDFTFWYPASDASRTQPALVEISFSYNTDDGEVDSNIALRASKLFVAMQSELSAMIAPGSQSKTSWALPSDCQEN